MHSISLVHGCLGLIFWEKNHIYAHVLGIIPYYYLTKKNGGLLCGKQHDWITVRENEAALWLSILLGLCWKPAASLSNSSLQLAGIVADCRYCSGCYGDCALGRCAGCTLWWLNSSTVSPLHVAVAGSGFPAQKD